MVYKPFETEETRERIEDRLSDSIVRVTNFVETSFNYVWTEIFAQRFKDVETAILASQLSGWVDYAGGPITQDDLDALDIETVEPDDVNEYINDQDLDELAKLVGVDRFDGRKASGEVEFETVDRAVDIDPGVEVSTPPDEDGETTNFVTTESIKNDTGETTATAEIEAEDVGVEYNTTNITYMPSPPSELLSVEETEATSDGEDPDTNEDFRDSIKNAIFEQSGGGTADGVKGFIRSSFDDVNSVSIDEFSDEDPPYVDVIVEGGDDDEIRDAIEDSRPVGIEHFLIRPDLLDINVSATVEGGSIDTDAAESAVTQYISSLDLGDRIVRDKIVQKIMNSDDDIDNIVSLDVEIDDEEQLYEGTSQDEDEIYPLLKGDEMEDDGVIEITGTLDESSHTFERGEDYDDVDDSGDGDDDAIDWGLDGDTPDTYNESDTITYEDGTDVYELDDRLITDGITDVSASSGDFTEDEDYEEYSSDNGSVDSIRWIGDTPNDGESFEVDYTIGTYFYVTYTIEEDVKIETREKANPDTIEVTE